MDIKIATSGYGTLPIQVADATICSNDSAYALGNSFGAKPARQGGKVKAYVDFSDFNKNYEEYLKKNGIRESSDESVSDSDSDERATSIDGGKVVLERQSSQSSNQSEEWEVISNST